MFHAPKYLHLFCDFRQLEGSCGERYSVSGPLDRAQILGKENHAVGATADMMEATFSVTTIITEEYVHPTSECVCRSVGINTEDMMNDSIDFAVNGARAVIKGTLRDRWGQVRTEFCDTVDISGESGR
jgi:hypothetical protein